MTIRQLISLFIVCDENGQICVDVQSKAYKHLLCKLGEDKLCVAVKQYLNEQIPIIEVV